MAITTQSPADLGLPNSDRIPEYILIRPASVDDCDGIVECFFTSFWVSHPFFLHAWPPRVFKPWLYDAFVMGITEDKSMRTFIAVDTRVTNPRARNVKDGRVAGFTRWRVPQPDGNRDEMWPAPAQDDGLDMAAIGGMFGGMVANRAELMGTKPHWFLQFLGTEVEYQKHGIGAAFVKWGCDLADKEDLPVCIDASEMGGPLYSKHFGTVPKVVIAIPENVKTYGKVTYWSHVRPTASETAAIVQTA